MNTVQLCEELHVLPRSGGLYDQDAMFVHLYMAYLEAKTKRQEMDNKKAQSKAKSPGHRRR